MYQVPINAQIQHRWPILLICFYYICAGIYAIIASIGFVLAMIETNMLNGRYTWFLLLLGLFLIINVSRLVLFIGLLKFWRWAYYGIIIVESIMILNCIRNLLNASPITRTSIVTAIIGSVILGYLFRPNIKRQFLHSKKA